MKKDGLDKTWFYKIITTFIPNDELEADGTPDEMIQLTAQKAFGISAGLGMIPGPVGIVAILPELTMLTKIQIELIYKIAKFYKKEQQLNYTLISLIFGNSLGVAIGSDFVKKVGPRIVIKAMTNKVVMEIAEKLGIKIGFSASAKAAGRWLPFVTAPVFGYFSMKMTEKIGKEADKLFASDLEIEVATTCNNGHDMPVESNFCPVCGVQVVND